MAVLVALLLTPECSYCRRGQQHGQQRAGRMRPAPSHDKQEDEHRSRQCHGGGLQSAQTSRE
jgi:hypothetical protein